MPAETKNINTVPQKPIINPQPTQTTLQPTTQSGGGGGSNFGGGIALSLFTFTDFLNQYMVDQQKVYEEGIGVQLSQTKVKEETTIHEYIKQGNLQWMDFGKSLLGAGISFGSFALDNYDTPLGTKAGTLNDEFNQQSKKLNELQGLNQNAKNKLPNAPERDLVSARLNPDGTPPAGLPAEAAKPDRLVDMENGNFVPNNEVNPAATGKQLEKQDAAKKALAEDELRKEFPEMTDAEFTAHINEPEIGGVETPLTQKQDEMADYLNNTPEGKAAIETKMNEIDSSQTDAALDYADKDSLRTVIDKSQEQIDVLSKQIETTNSRLTAARGQVRMLGEIAKGAGDAGFDAAKASITKDIGEIKASNQAATFSDEVLKQMQQNLSSQIKGNEDTLRSVLAALAQAATRA